MKNGGTDLLRKVRNSLCHHFWRRALQRGLCSQVKRHKCCFVDNGRPIKIFKLKRDMMEFILRGDHASESVKDALKWKSTGGRDQLGDLQQFRQEVKRR